MTGKNRENYNKNYIAYVNSFDPPTHHFKNCLRAFAVGGLICCIGQFFRYMLEYPMVRWDAGRSIRLGLFLMLGIITECYVNPVLTGLFLKTL